MSAQETMVPVTTYGNISSGAHQGLQLTLTSSHFSYTYPLDRADKNKEGNNVQSSSSSNTKTIHIPWSRVVNHQISHTTSPIHRVKVVAAIKSSQKNDDDKHQMPLQITKVFVLPDRQSLMAIQNDMEGRMHASSDTMAPTSDTNKKFEGAQRWLGRKPAAVETHATSSSDDTIDLEAMPPMKVTSQSSKNNTNSQAESDVAGMQATALVLGNADRGPENVKRKPFNQTQRGIDTTWLPPSVPPHSSNGQDNGPVGWSFGVHENHKFDGGVLLTEHPALLGCVGTHGGASTDGNFKKVRPTWTSQDLSLRFFPRSHTYPIQRRNKQESAITKASMLASREPGIGSDGAGETIISNHFQTTQPTNGQMERTWDGPSPRSNIDGQESFTSSEGLDLFVEARLVGDTEEETRRILDGLIVNAGSAIPVDPADKRRETRHRICALVFGALTLVAVTAILMTVILVSVMSTTSSRVSTETLVSLSPETSNVFARAPMTSPVPNLNSFFEPPLPPPLPPPPSTAPSHRPSNTPTKTPSNLPTSIPSKTPSNRPTATPSQTPSRRPITSTPSKTPTNQPSKTTGAPSSSPTATRDNRHCMGAKPLLVGEPVLEEDFWGSQSYDQVPYNSPQNVSGQFGSFLSLVSDCKFGNTYMAPSRWYHVSIEGPGTITTCDPRTTAEVVIHVYTDVNSCGEGTSPVICEGSLQYFNESGSICSTVSWDFSGDVFVQVTGGKNFSGLGESLYLALFDSSECEKAYSIDFPGAKHSLFIDGTSAAKAPSCGSASALNLPGMWFKIAGNSAWNLQTETYPCEGTTYISVYKGSCNSLECVVGNTCGTWESPVLWNAETDITYYILVQGEPSLLLNYTNSSSLTLYWVSNNENCTTAQRLGPIPDGDEYLLKVALTTAQKDPEVSHLGCDGSTFLVGTPRRGHWYTVHNNVVNLTYTVTLNNYIARLSVFQYDGSCDNLTCAGFTQEGNIPFSWESSAGQKFMIYIYDPRPEYTDLRFVMVLSAKTR